MKIVFTLLFAILMLLIWVFCMIFVALCTLYIIKVGLKEVFGFDVSGIYANAEDILRKIFSNVRES